jgi:hypothetical protein
MSQPPSTRDEFDWEAMAASLSTDELHQSESCANPVNQSVNIAWPDHQRPLVESSNSIPATVPPQEEPVGSDTASVSTSETTVVASTVSEVSSEPPNSIYAFAVPTDVDEFKRGLRAMVLEFVQKAIPTGHVKEIRGLAVRYKGERRPIAGMYRTAESMADAAITLTTAGALGVFFTAQSLKPETVWRSSGSLIVASSSVCAREEHIISYERVVIDVDPHLAVKDAPASDEERRLAHEVAFRVRDQLTVLGWPLPIIVDTGGGAHLHSFRSGDHESGDAASERAAEKR